MPPCDQPFIPYGHQLVDGDDIEAVLSVLSSAHLTTGPHVARFESEIEQKTGAFHAVAVSSGTAALHIALLAADIGPGDEVIVPAITFAATASTVLMCGATPVVVDTEKDTGLIEPKRVADAITARTRAVVAVDYAGIPCDYDALAAVIGAEDIILIADGCHSLGATYRDRPVGKLAVMTALSFHPVKLITTGEGGMVLTDDSTLATRLRRLRNHGIDRDSHQRHSTHTFEYDIVELGYNYRLSDIHCALGASQLKKLDRFIERRAEIAGQYDRFFEKQQGIAPLVIPSGRTSARHLYVIRVDATQVAGGRDRLFAQCRELGIGTNVHYKPLPRLTALAHRVRIGPGGVDNAEMLYEQILSLPIYPAMTDADVERVLGAFRHFLS